MKFPEKVYDERRWKLGNNFGKFYREFERKNNVQTYFSTIAK